MGDSSMQLRVRPACRSSVMSGLTCQISFSKAQKVRLVAESALLGYLVPESPGDTCCGLSPAARKATKRHLRTPWTEPRCTRARRIHQGISAFVYALTDPLTIPGTVMLSGVNTCESRGGDKFGDLRCISALP